MSSFFLFFFLTCSWDLFSIAAENKECFSPTLYSHGTIRNLICRVPTQFNSHRPFPEFEESTPACSNLFIFIYKVYFYLLMSTCLSCVGTLTGTLQH